MTIIETLGNHIHNSYIELRSLSEEKLDCEFVDTRNGAALRITETPDHRLTKTFIAADGEAEAVQTMDATVESIDDATAKAFVASVECWLNFCHVATAGRN